MSVEFLVTTLVVVVTPGAGVLYTLSAALSRGVRAGVIAAVGCTLGVLPHVLAAVTGLAALLHASAVAFQVVKYLGVAYLLWMAWATVRSEGALAEGPDAPRSARRVIVSGVLVNILNPKLTLFFLAFLPQFVAAAEPHPLLRMTELSAVFMLATLVVFAGYAAVAGTVRRQVVSRPRVMAWLRRTFAATFLALGARLAVADR